MISFAGVIGMATLDPQVGEEQVDLYELLDLDTPEKREALLRLKELGNPETPTSGYIFPLSHNSSVPPLGWPYIAKLARHPQ